MATMIMLTMEKYNENTMAVIRTDQNESLSISSYFHSNIQILDLRVDIKDCNTINAILQTLLESSVKTILVLLDFEESTMFLENISLNLEEDLFFINFVPSHPYGLEASYSSQHCFHQLEISPLLHNDSMLVFQGWRYLTKMENSTLFYIVKI